MAIGGHHLVDGVGLQVHGGELVGLVGPNGSGKTTVLRTLYRALDPTGGEVEVGGRPVASRRRRDLARRLAASTQEPAHVPGLSVWDAVALGRACHRGWLEPFGPDDHAVVAAALADVGLQELADRDVATLSGGERQRVSVGRALAQRPDVLVLDEPTNHLDLRHQLAVLDLLRRLADDGLAVLLTLHDLRLAVERCDRLVVIDAGRVVAQGPPTEVVDPVLLADVFGVHGGLRTVEGRPSLEIHGAVGGLGTRPRSVPEAGGGVREG